MLTWMRSHQKTIMTWTLYLVIPSFVLLYGYGQIQRPPEERWVVKVDGKEITYSEMLRMEDRLREQYQQQYADRFEEFMEGRDLRQESLDSLIRRQILLNTASQYGFGVSDSELAQYIVAIPAFQNENQQFDIRRYYYFLAQSRMTQEFFEETIREEILRTKITAFIASTMLRSMADTEKDFKDRQEQVTGDMLAFRPEKYTEQVQVEEDALTRFFEEHKEDYRVPEQRRVQYAEYRAADFRDRVEVTEGRLNAFFTRNQENYTAEETRRAEYVLYPVAGYIEQVSPTEQEVQEYFTKNQSKYRTVRSMQIRYISAPKEEWVNRQEVTAEDLQEWYDRNKARFTHQDEVRARHILLKTPVDATPEVETAMSTRVQEIRKEITDGLDFAEAAKKYSEDPGSAKDGGDLGFFDRNRMVTPFSDAAFSLEPGQVSEPVKTQYGYHLIKVEEKQAAHTETLDDVREEAESAIRQTKAREAFQEFSDGVKSLDELAGQYDIHTSDWFGPNEEIAGIDPADTTMVYYSAGRRKEHQRPEPVFGSETYYMIELLGDKPPRDKTFEESAEQVKADARSDAAHRQALSVAQSDLSRVKAGEITWDQLVTEKQLTPKQTVFFSRSTSAMEDFKGNFGSFASEAFGLEKVGDVAGPVRSDEGANLLRLAEIREAHLPELSEVEPRVRNDFIAAESGEQAHEEASKLADEVFNAEKSLQECATKLSVEIKESELFKAGDPIDPIGYVAEVSDQAFRMKQVGIVSDVIASRQQSRQQMQMNQPATGPIERCFVISLLEIKESYLPDLAEVREQVEEDYRLVQAVDIAKKEADSALNLIKEKIASGQPVSATQAIDLQVLVPSDETKEAPVNAEYLRPTGITQSGSYVPGVGPSAELRKTAFALKPGQVSSVIEVRETKYTPEGEPEPGKVIGYFVLQVLGRREAGPVVLDDNLTRMETYLEKNTQSMAFNAWIDSVSRHTNIEYSEEALAPAEIADETAEEEDVS
ncbi:MAG TPA: peptidyl-prolyl cis-trans isomerase [bacterium]|nr:peptidyl-prolyl cis-trans isomerase [bacterium]